MLFPKNDVLYLPTTTKLVLRFVELFSNSLRTSIPLLLGGGMSLTFKFATLLGRSPASDPSLEAASFCAFFVGLGAVVVFFPAD